MAYQITIKNSVHEKLKKLKGKGSYSDAIESMMNKHGIVVSDDLPKQTGTTASSPNKEIPACQT